MINPPIDMQDFVNAYIEALYFTEAGPDGPLELHMQLSPEAHARVFDDCMKFVEENSGLLREACDRIGYDSARAGQDFWLTRNGHGVGYWDRDELKDGRVGESLTEACGVIGSVDAVEGDDGMIHFE